MKYFLVAILILAMSAITKSKAEGGSLSLMFDATSCYSFEISKFYSNYTDEIKKHGFAFSQKVYLRSHEVLSVGIETGLYNIAALRADSVRADLNTIPICLIFSHDLKYFFLNTGIGYYYTMSKINTNGSISKSSGFEFGFMISASRYFKLNNWLGIVAEAEYCSITESQKSIISVGIGLSLTLPLYKAEK